MESTDIKVYEFELFKKDKTVVHGIFTRAGGTSKGAFDSLNIGINSGDEQSAIANNRKLIIRKMGMKPLVFLNQVHGDDIKVLKKDDNDLSEMFEPGKETYMADGIITDMKDVFLVIQVADCQAVMLYDPQKKVIANIHTGWQGSIKNIIGNCLDKMVLEFGCRPENIMAGISPSLGPCCSEFINYKDEIPQNLWEYKLKDKDYFDFWKMSADQLMEKGVKKDHIENMEICTKCTKEVFYSYRGEKTTGRFACVISMS
ncbi:MAG: peptidoglycan editing factor PgeF [Proteobacteria bacterium]|nr:peptidoglycan editing factor PgeF [Pseudomonadota bacterium]MBU1582644.1 peptidoglycan editing factor PgeF [Pseudomonadota bacterium]MBU2453852.1 peptidoglycan editing factor PgeF [Pseudomonadota bacterium]MBU2631330.1 peptidoglycan editing factor PgeF [Pseudomonadota bacterium]